MLGAHLRGAFIRGLEFINHGYAFIIVTAPNIKDSIDVGTRRQTPKRTVKRDDMAKNGEQGDGLRTSFSTRREKDTIIVPNIKAKTTSKQE